MHFRDHMRLMSGWHVWAFERLYAVVDGVDDARYRADTGLFFKSVHGTLNHMLLIEQMWRGRLTGDLLQISSLAEEIEPDRARLRERLLAHASLWGPMVEAMPDAVFDGDLTYRSMKGDTYTFPRASIVHTMFTHGAHHRGQITTVLTQWGCPAPEMDFPYYLASLRSNAG
jgi:uncharacterized damage-inducible protein DinB